MANNEAKLKENEEDLRRAQREFVQELEGANHAYSRNRREQQFIWISPHLFFKTTHSAAVFVFWDDQCPPLPCRQLLRFS